MRGRIGTTAAARMAAAIGAALLLSPGVGAHCDSLDGPVVMAAKQALEQKEVTMLLRWVRPADEAAIREAFTRTVAVRQLGEEAREVADRYFFETLVRVHRAGEGEPFTGLKPAGSTEPGIALADRALEQGSAGSLVDAVTDGIRREIEKRFVRVMEAKKHADESVQAGRTYVEAYVAFIHYVEGIHGAAGSAHQDGHEAAGTAHPH